jgi:hypothetical protein
VNVACDLHLSVVCNAIPNALRNVFVAHLVEDAITTKDNKIVLSLIELEGSDFRRGYDYIRVSAELLKLCLDISKRS